MLPELNNQARCRRIENRSGTATSLHVSRKQAYGTNWPLVGLIGRSENENFFHFCSN
jgi:hypothetical protein